MENLCDVPSPLDGLFLALLKTSSAGENLAFQPAAGYVFRMQTIVVIIVAFVRDIVLSRAGLQPENIDLRQHVAVLKRERPRPWLRPLDGVFWVYQGRPCHRHARNGHRLAPPGGPPVMEMEILPGKVGSPANLERSVGAML